MDAKLDLTQFVAQQPKICPACGMDHSQVPLEDLPEKCRADEESITLEEWLRTYAGPYPIKD